MNLTKPQMMIYNMVKAAEAVIANNCSSILISGQKTECELQFALNELFRLNDALRLRLDYREGEVTQHLTDFRYRNFDILRFNSAEELIEYADGYSKELFESPDILCDFKIVILPDKFGIIAKLHHIISDAWTFGLLYTQFNTIISKGREVSACSYVDYLEAEKTYTNSKRYLKDREFFLNQIKEIEHITLFSERESTSLDAKRKVFILDSKKAEKLKEFASVNNCSIFSVFSLIFAIYISRIKNNESRFFIGTTILNRYNERELNTAGVFVNTVPLLFNINSDTSFSANLETTEDSLLSVFRHQKYNYNDLLSDLRKDNKNHSGKLFDVMINYMNAAIGFSDECIHSTWHHNGKQNETLQINIDDRDNEGIFKIHYDYQTDKFTNEDIEQLHLHICNILEDVLANPDKKISQLSMLSEKEKNQLIYEFNDTKVEYKKDTCVYQLFEKQVIESPEKLAVVFKDNRLSYKALYTLVNLYADKLNSLGIKPNDVVAIHIERSHMVVVLQLAILKIGAIFMPLDKRYPEERLKYACDDCSVKLFITDEPLDSLDTAVINIKDFDKIPSTVTCDTVVNKDSCYIIYTSGSTGVPKGCLLTGKGLLNFCKNNNTLTTLNKIEDCIFACVNSVSFDYFIAESLLPLTNGFATVILDDNESTNQKLFIDVVEKNNVNVVMTTPTRLKIYFNDKIKTEVLSQIKCICTSGEPLMSDLLSQMYEKSPLAKVYNPIGPSECSVWDIGGELNREDGLDIHIGKPIANAQIYITDKYLNPVPIGVTGELCIAGDGVGSGYINKPELTAERFVENPFGEGKLYKTGDLAFWREDGNISYVGRNDFQVKIRGLRIELGEIENTVCSVDGITLAAAVVRKDAKDRQYICLFYAGEEKTSQEIRSVLSKRLPGYMMPHICVHLDEMPVNSNGKINRTALPETHLENINIDVVYVPPEGEKETALVESIEDILGIKRVSLLNSFFDIGGDSLKAIELTAELEKRGYEVSVKSIFTCGTLREIACAIRDKTEKCFKTEYGRELPVTAAQFRVYASQILKPDAVHYNIPFAFKVKELDVAKLEDAVNILLQRHESLRTHFENRNGTIVQVIENTATVRIEKLSDKDDSFFNTVFDLSKAPLLKIGYYENTIMVVMHHIISDGESMSVFFKELNELYMGRILPKPVQYGEFSVTDTYTNKNKNYWLDIFADEIPLTEFITDFPRPEKKSFVGTQLYDFIDGKTHRKIAAKCKEKEITPFVYYMACFSVLLSKFSGKDDVVASIPLSGRNSRFLNTIGMFVNTVPIRSKPEGNKKISAFFDEIKDISVGAIENQCYPLSEIMKNLGISASDRNPLSDIMFVYQNQQITDIVFGDEHAEVLPVAFQGAKCDLVFNIVPREGDVIIIAEYSTDLFKESSIKKFIYAYKKILDSALDGTAKIKDIYVLSSEEREKVIWEFNNTTVAYNKEECVYQLFEKQVAKKPDQAAVLFKDVRLSYKELETLIQSYADKLEHLGVNKGDVVAIHLERSHRLIALQLAVFKIGAIFLPLDKRFPAERLKLASDDCNVKLLITDEKTETDLSTEVLDVSDFESTKTTRTAQTVVNMDSCYIIYTSGSTGKPKGCLLTGTGLLNFCKNNNTLETLNKIENCVFACVNSVSFDYFIAESLLPLTNGFTTVVLDEKESTLQRLFSEVVVNNGINVVMTTPTRLKIYFGDNPNADALSHLRCICTSGEPLTAELLSQIYEKSPYAKVYNPIGPSECSVWDIGGELNREDGLDIHIGKPIANAKIYITDKYLNPVPIGVTGEICIGGDGVGAGYINNPELTAEKFVNNPFGKGLLYKTGDLAYWREDGNIVFVGRNDFQVKIRGLRIELGEIESAVCSVEGIELSVAVVRTDKNGVQYICVFYSGKKRNGTQIKAEIQKMLPSYMVPHIFVHLEEMPLTSSGKINRKALPEVSFVKEADIEEPANETEKLICDAFERILGLNRAGRNCDFFESGGTSLSMITLLSEEVFENITAAEFIRNPTPKYLSLLLEKSDKKSLDYLEALYVSENPERVLVVFPFGGGGAEGFSAFVNSIKFRHSNVSVFFVRYLHTVAECEKAAEEIKRVFRETEISFYSHCAGAAVAMNILKKLEKDNYFVKHYYAGGIIPAVTKSGRSLWDKYPDFVIEKTFVKAGAGFDGISDKAKKEIVSRFRKDTDFANKTFFEADSRFVTPVTVIIGKKDIFTLNYKKAEKQWNKFAENLYDVKFIDAKSHYFQSDNSDELTDILFG